MEQQVYKYKSTSSSHVRHFLFSIGPVAIGGKAPIAVHHDNTNGGYEGIKQCDRSRAPARTGAITVNSAGLRRGAGDPL